MLFFPVSAAPSIVELRNPSNHVPEFQIAQRKCFVHVVYHWSAKRVPPEFPSGGFSVSIFDGAKGQIRTDTGLPSPVFECDARPGHKLALVIISATI